MTLPTGGNACQKSTDDEAAQVYVAWLRSPEAVRSRIIGYVWDSTAPAGTICKSQKTSTVTYIVLRSGADELGKWITERRMSSKTSVRSMAKRRTTLPPSRSGSIRTIRAPAPSRSSDRSSSRGLDERHEGRQRSQVAPRHTRLQTVVSTGIPKCFGKS